MSAAPAQPPGPMPDGPLVPPLPSRARKKGSRKRPTNWRGLGWVGALLIGVGLGIAGYQWLPGVDSFFDYCIVLVLG